MDTRTNPRISEELKSNAIRCPSAKTAVALREAQEIMENRAARLVNQGIDAPVAPDIPASCLR